MGAVVSRETVTIKGIQTGKSYDDKGALMYPVGKLTSQRKELCFISETEMGVTLLTDANPGHVFHFLDDSAVQRGGEGGARGKGHYR